MKLFALLLLAVAIPAWGAPAAWQAQPDTGQIEFIATWNGSPVKGHFPDYSLKARLDPAHPGGGTITLHIDTRKLTAQSTDIARAIRGKAWFDVKDHPDASFISTSLSRQSTGQLELRGKLEIKGHEKTVSFPVKLKHHGKTLELRGTLTLDRGDFDIGTGQWASGGVIAHKVSVKFDFVLAHAD
jgi:polyisoprenoid-binding protein YceI